MPDCNCGEIHDHLCEHKQPVGSPRMEKVIVQIKHRVPVLTRKEAQLYASRAKTYGTWADRQYASILLRVARQFNKRGV